MSLNYNEVVQFMKDFGIDYLNRYDEFVVDEETKTHVTIANCNDIEELKSYVVFVLCRPIGKELAEVDAQRLLRKVNNYFGITLSRDDVRLMQQKLRYWEFQEFIKRGFPMDELKSV